jgi:hypothetical protein
MTARGALFCRLTACLPTSPTMGAMARQVREGFVGQVGVGAPGVPALFFLPFPPMGVPGRLSELATEVGCEQRFSY